MTTKNDEALATRQETALAPAPDYIAGGREGLESMTKQDLSIPRLALAQALSPQVTKGDPALIEGLEVGMLFNSMTKQVYGKEVTVHILRKDGFRAVEWFPLDDGGGIKDPNVKYGDSRLQWGKDGEKPIAMEYRDYIAVILPTREIIALSFKSSGIKVAKQLNGLIVLRNRPIYSGAYKISTDVELKPKPHQVFIVQNAGWVSQQDFELGKTMWEAVKDIDSSRIDRDNVHDDTDFPHVPAPGGGNVAEM